ncbi:MAG TPA: type II toxin-antitoxin system VapC family toxin [Ktedonobacterales bacterium]|nr:type II toxin-antitoxin system VapC family toxin [Ktedonobacterales bacterium]
MPAYFFDSSAIIKRYHREPGTAWVQAICETRVHPPLFLSQLAQVEVVAALRRIGRTGGLHHSWVDAMIHRFERHIALSDPARANPLYRLVPVTPPIFALASDLCNQYWQAQPSPLRSLDAIQLACALAAATGLSDELVFITADARLGAIASAEGFRVVNPSFAPLP